MADSVTETERGERERSQRKRAREAQRRAVFVQKVAKYVEDPQSLLSVMANDPPNSGTPPEDVDDLIESPTPPEVPPRNSNGNTSAAGAGNNNNENLNTAAAGSKRGSLSLSLTPAGQVVPCSPLVEANAFNPPSSKGHSETPVDLSYLQSVERICQEAERQHLGTHNQIKNNDNNNKVGSSGKGKGEVKETPPDGEGTPDPIEDSSPGGSLSPLVPTHLRMSSPLQPLPSSATPNSNITALERNTNGGTPTTPAEAAAKMEEEEIEMVKPIISEDMKRLHNYLPEELCKRFLSTGFKGVLYDWQAQCLQTPGVLEGKSLVYCAPTSGGKSLVAEILLLRRIVTTGRQGLLVLPYVSLCAEKADYLQSLLLGLNKQVFHCYGQHKMGPELPGTEFGLIICTIEKANALITRMIEEKALDRLSIVVTDELHMLGDISRGWKLEIMLTKLKYSFITGAGGDVQASQGGLQLVGMSATLPNVDEIASWLEAELFISHDRPVPLKHYILAGNELKDPTNLQVIRTVEAAPQPQGKEQQQVEDKDMMGALCWEIVSTGHSVLIFGPTKRECEITARELARLLTIPCSEEQKETRESVVLEISQSSEKRKDLFDCIQSGTAYHHAGLTDEERAGVERAYRSGACRILVATSTLAAGVNLPARRVIFRQPYQGLASNVYSPTKYKQMAGRAGRAGIDTVGESILVLTDGFKEDTLQSIVEGEDTKIKSCLLGEGEGGDKGMNALLLEGICSGSVESPEDIKNYVGCTLAVATEGKFTEAFGQKVGERLKNLCQQAQLIKWDETSYTYKPSNNGKAVGMCGLEPKEGLQVFQALDKARENFIMKNDLHMVYLITPLKSEFKMQKDHWTIFYKLFMTQFNELDSKVMEAVGVSINLLIKKNRGERASYDVTTNQIEQNARRFYLALILRDLIKEVPPSEVEAKFQFSLASIEKLQELSSMFASMASVMCERLGWTDLAGLINKFQSRVLSGAGAEILSLTEIPGMKTIKARILYKAQIRSPEDVVQCATEHIAQVLARSASKYKGNERISNKRIFAIESKAAKSIMRGAQELIERKKEELQKQMARYNNITGQSLTADSTLEDPSLVKKKGLKELKTMEQLEKLHVHLKESCTNISLMLYSRNVEVVAQHRTSLGLKGTPDRKDIYSQQDATEEKLLGITLCFSPRAVVYLPLFKSDGSSYGDDKGEGFQARVWELLVFILGREELKKATWDWKPQLKVLKRACLSLGAEWRDPKICQCYDMRIAAWLLSPDDEEIKDTLSLRWRGLETVTKRYTTLNSAVYSCIGKGERSMGEGTLVFACRNTARTYDVFDPLLKKLESEDLVDSFVRIEMALVPVLAEMETKGVPFDAEVYKASLPSINALLAQLAEKAWVEAGTIFNISSPSDVSRILFQVLRLDPIPGSVSKSSSKKRQYINISTKAEYLEQLSSEHPLPKTILKHRQLSRLLQEMSVTLPDCSIQSASQIMVSCSVNSNGKQVHMNRIKGHFLQTSSSTGRLAMDEPNLQKVPREKKISLGTSQEVLEGSSKVSNFNPRLAFTSISEFVILSADYAQLELRLMAHFSQDPVLLEAIKQGQRDRKKDFFTLLASRWQGIPTEVVTNDVRDKAKRLTYGILYGMGPERLSVELKCDIAKAQEQANAFKVCLGGVTHWIAGTLKKVEKQGFVETLGGRKRYFPLLAAAGKGKNVNFGNKAQEERQAINTVCQGSAADIVKAAMVDIHKQLQNDKKLGSRCHMIHMIHDELLFEVRRTCLDQAALLVKESMERSWKEALTVPLEARLQVGDSWGSMDVYNTTE